MYVVTKNSGLCFGIDHKALTGSGVSDEAHRFPLPRPGYPDADTDQFTALLYVLVLISLRFRKSNI